MYKKQKVSYLGYGGCREGLNADRTKSGLVGHYQVSPYCFLLNNYQKFRNVAEVRFNNKKNKYNTIISFLMVPSEPWDPVSGQYIV